MPLSERSKCARREYFAYCYGENKLFGERYVALIADYLGLAWDHTADIVRRLSIYLRAFTIVDDDLRDIPSKVNDCSLNGLRQHFLGSAWQLIDELSSPIMDPAQNLTAELHRYNEASDFYAKLHLNAGPAAVDWTYTDRYADRMALVRMPFLLLKPQTDCDRVSNGIIAVEGLMKALQILDDLVDWQEDLREGRVTYPTLCYCSSTSTTLVQQLRNITRSGPKAMEHTIHNIEAELPYHPIIREQLERSCGIVKEASSALKEGQGDTLWRRTIEIGNRLEAVLAECDHLKGSVERDNLVLRIQRSGAAPQRLHKERGENVESRRASVD